MDRLFAHNRFLHRKDALKDTALLKSLCKKYNIIAVVTATGDTIPLEERLK